MGVTAALTTSFLELPPYFKTLTLARSSMIHLVLYNLKREHPEADDFRWKEDICRIIDEVWAHLWPEKLRKRL